MDETKIYPNRQTLKYISSTAFQVREGLQNSRRTAEKQIM